MPPQAPSLCNAAVDWPTDAVETTPWLGAQLTARRPQSHPVQRNTMRRGHQQQRPDLRRVLALTLTATLHLSVLGALLLPDTHPEVDRPERPAATATDAASRLTLFVELHEPTAEPPPPRPPAAQPAPPPRLREPVPIAVAPPVSIPSTAPPVVAAIATAPAAPTAANLSSAPIAADELARPSTQATATDTAAPSITPDVARREREAYIKALMAALLQQRVYPAAARKEREQGVVHVRFTIDRDGQLLAANVQRGAGLLLDAAALEVLQRAAPLPAIPLSMGKQTLTITLPIEYSLTTR